MKKIYTILGAMAATFALHSQTLVDSLTYTGGIQTWTVPCGVTSVMIQVYAGQGGSGAAGGNSSAGGNGGLGGYATGTLTVAPGDILNVFVGGAGVTPAGGFNGGANGGTQDAGGGGGATDVRVNGTALTDRVITAGGGGGGGRGGCELASVGGGVGGAGGSGAGGNGVDAPTPNANPTGVAGGGQGGTIAAGGAAGIGCSGFLGSAGTAGTSGNGGVGGAGQSCCCFSAASIPGGGGGGGGGGFMGGGGGGGGSAGTTGCSGNDKGGGGGGAGGSNDVSGVSSGAVASGIRQGNGAVYFYYTLPTPGTLTVSGNTSICEGTSGNLTCTSDPNTDTYTWSINPSTGLNITSGQGTNSLGVVATAAGTYTVSVFGANTPCALTGPTSTYTVTVNPVPAVTATTLNSNICVGETATLAATGAANYAWMPGSLTGNTVTVTPSSTTTYTVTGVDANGCTNTSTVTVTVSPCTGILSEAVSSVSILPNPATDVLHLTWNGKEEMITFEIYDNAGKLVKSQQVTGGNNVDIAINELPVANYTLTVKSATASANYSFIKK